MLAKYTEVMIGGRKTELSYTVAAMLEINELIGEEDLYEVLVDAKGEKFGLFCEVLHILVKCAGKAREAEGEEKKEGITSEELEACMSPAEYLTCKKAAMNAVLMGYGREIMDENQEIDIGLAELEKKRNQQGHTY